MNRTWAASRRAVMTVASNEATMKCAVISSASLRLLAVAVLSVLPSLAAAQVLNMSRDLIPLGIASQNLIPDTPSQDARPLIQAALQYVQNHPVQVLTVDKGNYYLLTAQQPNATLLFGRLANFTVDLAGSTIYFNGPLLPNGIQVFQCTNFTLKNFQIDYLAPPYTHVQLVSVDPVQRLLRYQTLEGWPDPSKFNDLKSPFGGAVDGIWAAMFRNGAIVPGTTRTLITRPIAGNTLALVQDGTPWTQRETLSTLRTGDTVVVAARGGGPPILVWEGDAVTLSNIAVYGSPTWAIQLYATSNSTVDGVRVVPRPATGLLGSNADGIHFHSVRQNNQIRNSYVTRTLDDALAMDSHHSALVITKTGPRQLNATRNQYLRFPNGTAVNFIDPATTIEVAGATIVSQNPPDSDAPSFSGQVELTFDRDLPALTPGMGMVYGTPAMRGQGSTIEDNLVEDTYGGRGIWISGAQGLIMQRNVIRRTSLAGIMVFQSTDPIDLPDLGPPSHDIIIRDNVVEGALGPASNGTGAQVALASIQVTSTNNQQVGFASAGSNTNISVENNRITNSGRSAIWIGELNGGSIQNNLIGPFNQLPGLGVWGIPPVFLSQVIADFASSIVVRYSSGVVSQSNPVYPVVTVVEYYNASFDHYFITWLADEIAKLDAGNMINGWARTGQSFNAYTTAQTGTSPICRYYIPPTLGDSHFFGRGTYECDSTGTKNPSFILEDPSFMHMFLPSLGVCPANTTPVYRVFSNRRDANHRYMTDRMVREHMNSRGWLAEGDGSDLVVMCGPH